MLSCPRHPSGSRPQEPVAGVWPTPVLVVDLEPLRSFTPLPDGEDSSPSRTGVDVYVITFCVQSFNLMDRGFPSRQNGHGALQKIVRAERQNVVGCGESSRRQRINRSGLSG